MACNYENKAVECFLLPECPNKGNYMSRVAYKAALMVYRCDHACVLDEHEHWKQWERLEDACHKAEAAKTKAAADARHQGGVERVKKCPRIKEGEAGLSIEHCKCCIAKGNVLLFAVLLLLMVCVGL